MRTVRVIALVLIAAASLTAQQRRAAPKANSPAVAPKSAGERPKFKAIWEPVNFAEDVQLNSVAFVDDKNGWATGGVRGRGGVIIHTADGGEHWEIQLGDVQSAEREYQQLKMVDANTGFAIQHTGLASNLLRTTDGQHWLPSGKIPEHIRDYQFLSATTGIATENDKILRTVDGGKKWTEVARCAARVEVQGLARNTNCELRALHFPTPEIGYGVGMSSGVKGMAFVAKTTDGGQTWGVLAVPTEEQGGEDVIFLDENTGYMRIGYVESGQLMKTSDGGETWTRIAVAAGTKMRFAAGKRAGW